MLNGNKCHHDVEDTNIFCISVGVNSTRTLIGLWKSKEMILIRCANGRSSSPQSPTDLQTFYVTIIYDATDCLALVYKEKKSENQK